ncbi:hypothetical protein VTK73DRAFT_3823 [Phialemonium thermophilum]|uniref:Uncharacterized protein n=1 Tax=Phialemonium thermophilum TaxID=223376 RepID=A0ABR3VER4_9PEZI
MCFAQGFSPTFITNDRATGVRCRAWPLLASAAARKLSPPHSGDLWDPRLHQGQRGLAGAVSRARVSIAGVAPATAVKFYVYGNCKRLGASVLDRSQDDPLVHAQAAVLAGIATATATNLICLVKTRLQLDRFQAEGGVTRQYQGSVDFVR